MGKFLFSLDNRILVIIFDVDNFLHLKIIKTMMSERLEA